ncbi:hypothetical protein K9O30_07310 [Clostridium bowmanii]|uniref:hypothetical protein n=1 Tax=Clostridium bowmanii TaxID=132925 RepID=UPI001C0B85A7|nr:hypothetical protein [Clostridium bowmanii]MBU3189614.1 hypothetical protein [Clostridium bowmanii]MCA1073542.1 hypothetical protein [Clostridium bowmanii]
MTRKFEKSIALVGSVWQIVSGIVTMLIYATWIRSQGPGLKIATDKFISLKLLTNNIYIFTVTFGMLYFLVGVINFYLARRLNINKVEVKTPIWFVICGIISLCFMDFIGTLTFIISGLTALARNKSISASQGN